MIFPFVLSLTDLASKFQVWLGFIYMSLVKQSCEMVCWVSNFKCFPYGRTAVHMYASGRRGVPPLLGPMKKVAHWVLWANFWRKKPALMCKNLDNGI